MPGGSIDAWGVRWRETSDDAASEVPIRRSGWRSSPVNGSADAPLGYGAWGSRGSRFRMEALGSSGEPSPWEAVPLDEGLWTSGRVFPPTFDGWPLSDSLARGIAAEEGREESYLGYVLLYEPGSGGDAMDDLVGVVLGQPGLEAPYLELLILSATSCAGTETCFGGYSVVFVAELVHGWSKEIPPTDGFRSDWQITTTASTTSRSGRGWSTGIELAQALVPLLSVELETTSGGYLIASDSAPDDLFPWLGLGTIVLRGGPNWSDVEWDSQGIPCPVGGCDLVEASTEEGCLVMAQAVGDQSAWALGSLTSYNVMVSLAPSASPPIALTDTFWAYVGAVQEVVALAEAAAYCAETTESVPDDTGIDTGPAEDAGASSRSTGRAP